MDGATSFFLNILERSGKWSFVLFNAQGNQILRVSFFKNAAVVNRFVTIRLLHFCSLWSTAAGAVITKSSESKFSFTQQKYKHHLHLDFFFADECQSFYKESSFLRFFPDVL